MSKDAMTPLERAQALRAGRPVDRLRCVPSMSNTAARVIGVKVSELRSDAKLLAKATIDSYRRFGYDTVRVFTDLYIQPEAMGAKVRVPLDETAHLDGPAIDKIEDLDKLVPLDPGKDGNIPAHLEATRIVLDELGGEVPVSCALEGPFTLASLLVGTDELLRWMYKRPEAARQAVDLAYEACRRFADAILDLGAGISITDAMNSSSIISPRHFREFSLPVLTRLISHIKTRKPGLPVTLHICGNTSPIWEGMADSGAACISIDNMADLEQAKKKVGKRVCLMGNVPPSEVLLQGTPAEVRTAARKCVVKAWDNPAGFVLATGCSLPTETPFANIDAMMEAAREIGWPIDPEKLREAV